MSIDISKINATHSKAAEKEGNKSWSNLLNQDIQLFNRGLSNKQKERFYAELHILLTSGLDLRSALELIATEQTDKKQQALTHKIKEAIVNGDSLYEAMEGSGQFSTYEFYSIKIGEESGRLIDILEDLVKYFQEKIKQSRQVISSFSYPAIVTLTAFFAVTFMLNFIVPMFAGVYQRFGGDLPWLTKVVLALSDSFKGNILYALAVLLILIIVLFTQRKKNWLRQYSSWLVLRIPIIGEVLRKVYLARFCRIMALLSSAKVPMLYAVELVQKMIGFYPLEQSLEQVKQDIMNGVLLHKSLSQFSIYDRRMVALVKVGEEVNQLDSMFEKLTNQMTEEVEHRTGVLSSMLEPFLIIFLALIVGVILVAMYLPMFQMSTGM